MNFVIIKSGFGEYWIGKTKLPIKEGSIFGTFEDTVDCAIDMADSITNQADLEDEIEEEVEEISKEMERWIA
jgi:hypothetical protein